MYHLFDFFLKTYILSSKNTLNNFLRVTFKLIPLNMHVSERAKLYCQPDPAIESCLYSELPHLFPTIFVL